MWFSVVALLTHHNISNLFVKFDNMSLLCKCSKKKTFIGINEIIYMTLLSWMFLKYLRGKVILTNKVPYELGGLERHSPLTQIVIFQSFLSTYIFFYFLSITRNICKKKIHHNRSKKLFSPISLQILFFAKVSDNFKKKKSMKKKYSENLFNNIF